MALGANWGNLKANLSHYSNHKQLIDCSVDFFTETKSPSRDIIDIELEVVIYRRLKVPAIF